MVRPTGMEAYDVSCTECSWKDTVTVNLGIGEMAMAKILKNLGLPSPGRRSVPGKCPECGAKVNKKQLPLVF